MPRLILALLLVLAAAPALASAGQFEPGLCFGQAATIDDHAGEIVGTPGDDVIVGDDGPNVIYGEGGEDTVCMGGGNDRFDQPCCEDETSGVRVDAGPGDDEVNSSAQGHNEILGGSGNDEIYPFGATTNTVDAGAGNDYILSYQGNSAIDGGAGDDWIEGGEDDDTIRGGEGTDELYGRGGFDALDGGASFDTERVRIKRPGRDRIKKVRVEHEDLCQVGPGGGTRANCEREV